ncbi:MAG: hypothetical protein ABIS26_01890 [Candidatus Paceibacterota bacterium]
MKECTRCLEKKAIEEFNFKNKAKNTRQSQCKKCTRFLIKNHYNNNRQYYLDKTKKRNILLRKMINSYLLKYLVSHPCIDCGEKDPAVLEFDHKGEMPKFRAISQLVRLQYPIEVIQLEIDKCEIRCANCHRRKTAKDYKWYKLMHP